VKVGLHQVANNHKGKAANLISESTSMLVYAELSHIDIVTFQVDKSVS